MEEQQISEQPIQEGEIITETDLGEQKKQQARERMAKAREARNKRVKPKPKVKLSPSIKLGDPIPRPVPEAPVIKVDKSSDEPIVFFTEADIDPNTKKIKNTYPTYFNRKQRDDLEEEIRKMEKGLANNYYQQGDIGKVRDTLAKARASLDKIQEYAPVFEKQKDRIHEMNKDLEERIRPSMFTRSDMMKGLADAHEEARRMSEPIIELSPEMAGTALANGMNVHPGNRVSRDTAIRLWQFGRKALGEMTDAESLRRD
jgi:hypothetical protein